MFKFRRRLSDFLFGHTRDDSKNNDENFKVQSDTETLQPSDIFKEDVRSGSASENTYSFERLRNEGEYFYITKPKPYTKTHSFRPDTIIKVFDFAYQMSFGNKGKHRDHRSGGNHRRKNGEIFSNVFQGKLAECAIYNEVYKYGTTRDIDFNTYELGKWDDADIVVNEKKIAVKSTKDFGNLLLLETKDWNSSGQYIPNIGTDNAEYDFIAVARIKPSCEKLLKSNHCFYSDKAGYDYLKNIILSCKWEYNTAGYVTLDEIIYIIENKMIIPKGGMLNGTTKMDAENYYIQLGDLHSIDELKTVFTNK